MHGRRSNCAARLSLERSQARFFFLRDAQYFRHVNASQCEFFFSLVFAGGESDTGPSAIFSHETALPMFFPRAVAVSEIRVPGNIFLRESVIGTVYGFRIYSSSYRGDAYANINALADGRPRRKLVNMMLAHMTSSLYARHTASIRGLLMATLTGDEHDP